VRGTGLLLACGIGQGFAAVGAQEEKREDQAAEAEHREHDQACGTQAAGKRFRSVILSEAKNRRSFSQVLEPKPTAEILREVYPEGTAEILLPRLRDQNDKRRAQDDSRLIFPHLLSEWDQGG
jgi:hypothetical protein